MKNQALFSSKDKSKKLKCCLLQFLFGALRVNKLMKTQPLSCCLTHCILVNSSTVICWMSPFVILERQVYFVAFILFLMETPVSKKCRP